MNDEIESWLDRLGLGGYAQVFASNDVDCRALPHLADNDLRELGVSLGHRKIILAAIAALNSDSTSAEQGGRLTPGLAQAALGETDRDPVSPLGPREAERRLLTVFFCDLVGSTALTERLDPEDVREVLRRYQDAVAGSVTRYGGHVAKFLGDGVLAYFGWPMAYEDHAERAVRAGLDAMAAVQSVQVHEDGGMLQARVGLASGQVVVGDLVGTGGREEGAIAGHTPNLAYRLQEIAEPGQLLVAEATRKLIHEAFRIEDRGERELKGVRQPVRAFSILGERHVDSRFEALHSGILSPFIGRVHELGILVERWELARAGQGQAVFISGEAGIGKSRLVQVLVDRLRDLPHELIKMQCSPYHLSTAFYPVIARLSHAAGFAGDDATEARLDKLERLLADNAEDVASVGAVYAALMSLDPGARYKSVNVPPAQLKELTLDALVGRLALMAERRPVLLIIEDSHWLDPSTHELLERVLARISDLAVMLIVTHRPEWSADWAAGYNHAATLTLGRLSWPQITELVRAVLGSEPSQELLKSIADRTDGVPLFVEELTRTIIDHESDASQKLDEIPATLQGSLMARLDRLSPSAKEVAQIASIIGREFTTGLLSRVGPASGAALDEALQDLARARLVIMSGLSNNAHLFRHALIQDVAYQSCLMRKRRAYHKKIGETLAADFPDTAETQPELIARHFSEANLPEKALPFWKRAAERALARSANYEAVDCSERALKIASGLSDLGIRRRETLANRLTLGKALENAGRLRDAATHHRTSANQARDEGNKDAFVEATLGFDVAQFLSGEPQHESVALLEEALSLVGDSDMRMRCLLLSRLARAYLLGGDGKSSMRYNQCATDLALRLNDRMSLFNLQVNSFLIPASAQPDRDLRKWSTQMDEIYALADGLDDNDARGRALSMDVYVSAEFADRERMDRAIDKLSVLGESRQRMHIQWIVRHGRAMQALLDGNFGDAEQHAEAALELGPKTYGQRFEGVYGIQMFTIRREQGRLSEVAPIIKHLVDSEPGLTTWKPGFALVACDLGFKEPAQRVLDELAASDFVFPIDAARSTTLAYLVEVCVAVEDHARAARLYEHLLPYRFKTITAGVTTVCYGAADRFLGLLASLLEKWQVAEDHFDTALEINEKMRALPWLAHARYDFATMLLRRGGRDGARRGDRLLGESLEAAMDLDMVALRQKIQGRHH